jgi:hypothetical protein
MIILAIDPGPVQSAYCVYDTGKDTPLEFGIYPNNRMRQKIAVTNAQRLVIEMIASYGMPVGETVFLTCLEIGRFIEQYAPSATSWQNNSLPANIYLMPRKEVKEHICHSLRANDANIRQALIDRYGSVGTRKKPGILYGVKGDMWAALAVAVTYANTHIH